MLFASHRQSIRGVEAAVAAIVTVAVVSVAVWVTLRDASDQTVVTDELRDTPASAASALAYVRKRPFDTAGWLAWGGASGDLTAPQTSSADAAIAAAAAIAPFDPQVLRARAIRLGARGDHEGALLTLRTVARAGDAERASAYSAMFPLIGTSAFASFLAQELKSRSGIADDLLLQACRAGLDIGRLALFAQLVVRDHAVDDDTVNCVAERATAQNQTSFAYWFWLNGSRKLPRTIAHVLNGDFDGPSGNGVFDWKISAGGEYRDGFSARVKADETPGRRGNLLTVRLNGRPLTSSIARQVLALPAGSYRLTYNISPAELRGTNPLAWQVRCLNSQSALTSSSRAMNAESRWQAVELIFAVPPACSGQELILGSANKLAAAEGGRGTLLYDDIRISSAP